MTLYINAVNGISGNMIVAALIDLGADRDVVITTAEKAASILTRTRAKLVTIHRDGVRALYLDTVCEDKPFRIEALKEAILSADLTDRVKALRVLDTLIIAEQEYHRTKDIHFHEIGCADLVFDIVGCMKAIELLGESEIISSPVAVGGGKVAFSHGILEVPAPATRIILDRYRIPFYRGPIDVELTTPTGAAILANIVRGYGTCNQEGNRGYGAGRRYKGIPNILEIRKF